jgi:autotransporter-associated beta strand protein
LIANLPTTTWYNEVNIGNGVGSNGSVVMTGGTMSTLGGDPVNWIAVSNNTGAIGSLTMSGNSYVATDDLQVAYGGTGTVVIGDGNLAHNAVATARLVEIGCEYQNDVADSVATLTVNKGGTLETSQIQSSAYGSQSPLSTVINFNGGTVKALLADNPTFIANSGSSTVFQVNVQDYGMTVNTNGFNVGIGVPLLHSGMADIDGGVTKAGAGTLYLNPTSANTYTGLTTVQAGTLRLGALAQAAVIGVGGTGSAGNVNLMTSGTTTAPVTGKLVFDSAPGLADAIKALLTTSYNDGVDSWTTGTFRSTTAAAYGMTLGWVDSSVSAGAVAQGASGDGPTITVAPTYPGDFNLDGQVNGDDLTIWTAHFGATPASWQLGDANYSGSINGDDLTLWKANFGRSPITIGGAAVDAPVASGSSFAGSAGPAASSGVALVPEPGTFALLLPVLALFGYVVARRRRK